VSSCAQDDDSDRGEDQEDVPSFVVPVTPGDEVASLRFDDTHNYGDAEGDSMGMSPQQAGSRTPCTPLDYRCLCLWIACCVARQIVNVDESYAWSKAPYVSIPGIASIMSRDRYLAIKSALSFHVQVVSRTLFLHD
jgi:hypothetical protein